METISKAQQKRDRENTQYIDTNLRKKLEQFENQYLKACVSFEFHIRDLAIKQNEQLIEQYPTRVVTRHNQRITIKDYQNRIERVKRELELDMKITREALVLAKASYDQKVDRLVNELVSEGFGYANFKVEEIRDRGSKLEFLISKSDKEVHARLIWVEATQKTPHFRFITTTRKK